MKDDRRKMKGKAQFIIHHSQFVIRNLIWWTCLSLIAIVILEGNALLGLQVAVVGGIALGILLFVK